MSTSACLKPGRCFYSFKHTLDGECEAKARILVDLMTASRVDRTTVSLAVFLKAHVFTNCALRFENPIVEEECSTHLTVSALEFVFRCDSASASRDPRNSYEENERD